MVSSKYYVRVRGRVIGPFSEEKLRQMASRGQVGQTHEVSPDAVTWRRASEYKGLFEEDGESTTAVEKEGDRVPSASSSGTEPAQPKTNKEKSWFLNQGDDNLGPFTAEEVRSRITSGTVSRDALTWQEGMSDWNAVLEVFPDLKQPIMQPSGSEESDASRHSKSTEKHAADNTAFIGTLLMSRPWILFLAITFITVTSLTGIGAFTALVIGIAADTSAQVAEVYLTICGLTVVTSITLLINALLLLQCSNRLGLLRYKREQRVLELVANDVNRLCKYTGIVVIVWLGIYLAAYLFSLVLAAKGVI